MWRATPWQGCGNQSLRPIESARGHHEPWSGRMVARYQQVMHPAHSRGQQLHISAKRVTAETSLYATSVLDLRQSITVVKRLGQVKRYNTHKKYCYTPFAVRY